MTAIKTAAAAAAKRSRNRFKAYACRVSSGIIGAGTPIAVIVLSPELYFFKPAASVSAIALIAIILGAVSFKGSILKFIKTPTALKIWAAVFVLALLARQFAEQIVIVSAFALAAQGLCVPSNLLDKHCIELYKAEINAPPEVKPV